MKKIFIDIGHGGEDPGAVDGIKPDELDKIHSKEAEINLLIGKKVFEILKNRGYNVEISRQQDETIYLKERSDMANEFGADLFVSIHNNAAANKSAQGYEVLYWHTSDQGKLLARKVFKAMSKATNWNGRGIVARDNLHVLRETEMPAVLVEGGFITNPVEEHLLDHEGYRLLLAEGIVNGIEDYFEGV